MLRRSDSYRLAAEALRKLSRTRYYATLVLPRRYRGSVQALYAYAAELAAVRQRVSEPGAGEVRLKWWSDALSGTEHGDVRANPVADALLDVVERLGLPERGLIRMAEARRFDLSGEPMPNLTQFEGYAGETVSTLYQYAALIANGGKDPGTADAAGHLGVGEALVDALFELPRDLSHGRIRVPLSVFSATGASADDLLTGNTTPGVLAATAQLREVARGHLRKAQVALPKVARPLRPVFAPIAVADLLLSRLEQHADEPLKPVPPLADLRKLWAIFARSLVI